MLNMVDMYNEFYSKNLIEYDKIVKVLDSCESWEQFLCIENIAYNFARNCEWRTNKLFDHYERGFSIKRYKEFRSYERAAKIQCEDLMGRVKDWASQYQNALEEAKLIIAKEEEEAKKRKVVTGFKFPKKKKTTKRS